MNKAFRQDYKSRRDELAGLLNRMGKEDVKFDKIDAPVFPVHKNLWKNTLADMFKPHTGVIFLIGALYLVSGWVLDSTVQTYETWEREFFARKYGRWFPFLIGLGGPFYLAWEFFSNLWRYS